MAWIFVLVAVVFIHELGHFLVARWCGVNVSTFSIGFGREIFGFTDKHGTRWKIGWLPLGGYVKFMDDENAASVPSKAKLDAMTPEQRSRSFQGKPLWQRAAVVAAGPMANFASAILMFAGTAYVLGQQTLPAIIKVKPLNPAVVAGLKTGDVVTAVDGAVQTSFGELMATVAKAPGRELVFSVIRNGQPLTLKVTPERQPAARAGSADDIGVLGLQDAGAAVGGVAVAVKPNYAAVTAGLKTGDRVVRIDGQEITGFMYLSQVIARSAGRELTFEVVRGGAPVTLKVRPDNQKVPDNFGGEETRGIIGVEPGADRSQIPVVYPSLLGALQSGVEQTWQVITSTLGYFLDVSRGQQSTEKIGGIATVIDVSNKIATYGIGPLVQLIALLSVSIGLLNLFPIPLLDGGHLMYYAAEAILGRPLSEQTQEFGFRIGLAVVSMLFGLALWNDRFRIQKWISNLVALVS